MRKFTEKLDEMFGHPEEPQIPTAVEFLHNFPGGVPDDDDTVFKAMIAFAKLHVEKALNQVYEHGEIEEVKKVDKYDYADKSNYGINKNSIIRAYPLSNIK